MTERKDIWCAIVNPHAGSGKTISLWQKTEVRLRELRIPYTSLKTEYKRHAVKLVLDAAAEGYRKFLAVGGDGTAHEVLSGLMSFYALGGCHLRDFTVGVIPIGSGNDWIRSHHVPNDIEKVLELISQKKIFQQDIVKVTRLNPDLLTGEPLSVDYMLNIGGIGFDSRVCERVNVLKDMGKRARMIYAKALIKVLMHFYSFPVRIETDGELFYEGDCYSMAFGIGPYSGGGMRQVPGAVMNDGLLDMCLVPKMNIWKIAVQIGKLFNGKMESFKGLSFTKNRTITVLPVGDIFEPIEIDGEMIGRFPVRFEVLPEKLNVISNLE